MEQNLILYGPPGTGKTYETALRAVALIDGKTLDEVRSLDYEKELKPRYEALMAAGQIKFVTFHQSYSYEDFIEGIRPVLYKKIEKNEEGDKGEEDAGGIRYKMWKGAFKDFCETASDAKRAEGAEQGEVDNFDEAWEKLLAYFDDAEIDAETGSKLLRVPLVSESGTIDLELRNDGKGLRANPISGRYFNKAQLTRVYHGQSGMPSGALDSYHRAIISHMTEKFGLVPYKLPLTASFSKFVFIIDEINRGDISRIFGEIITLVEPSKRMGSREECTAALPYSGEPFGVPDNVYIIGTMNTADRSIALLDTALRRRFGFAEMMPNAALLKEKRVALADGKYIDIAALLQTLNDRITVLLSRERTIGHSFFWHLTDASTIEDLANVFEHKIVPLLQEYFYDDYEKIRLVLGDNQKTGEPQFVLRHAASLDLFGADVPEAEDVYEINRAAFKLSEAYAYLK